MDTLAFGILDDALITSDIDHCFSPWFSQSLEAKFLLAVDHIRNQENNSDIIMRFRNKVCKDAVHAHVIDWWVTLPSQSEQGTEFPLRPKKKKNGRAFNLADRQT